MVGCLVAWSNANPCRPSIVIFGSKTFRADPKSPEVYAQHSWTIKNAGTIPLKLRTHFTSGRCGFSLWLGRDTIIPPDGEIVVSLTWRTPSNGSIPYSNHAEVWTTDPDLPKVQLKVVGITEKSSPTAKP